MNSHPYILVVFLRDLPKGYEFERWPHHITLLPWFKADREALESLADLAGQYLPMTVEMTKTANFGVRDDILVRLVESDALVSLHKKMLSNRDGILGLANGRYVGEEFKPHVTLQGKNDPEPGSIAINRISLIKHTGSGHIKRVERIFG